jgi:hypothetical protein
VDQSIHTKKQGIQYATANTKNSGWFAVELLSVQLESSSSSVTEKILVESDEKVLNTGKGVIVDSGTTDTYLPAAIATKFQAAFKKATNNAIAFSNNNIPLTAEQLKALPTIVFTLQGTADKDDKVVISMPSSSYVDSVGGGKYAFRVYLTEKSGAVLGANFMIDHNIIFDAQGGRVGFAKSTCNYLEFAPVVTDSPTAKPVASPTNNNKDNKDKVNVVEGPECDPLGLTAYTACTASCDRNDTVAYVSTGKQQFIPACPLPSGVSLPTAITTRDCSENCSRTHSVRGNALCPDTAWSECTHGCIMSRKVVPPTEPLHATHGTQHFFQLLYCD